MANLPADQPPGIPIMPKDNLNNVKACLDSIPISMFYSYKYTCKVNQQSNIFYIIYQKSGILLKDYCSAKRATPDVSLDADPISGASVYDSSNNYCK